MRGTFFGFALLIALGACRDGNQPDAYGNFETTEVVVSAETSGQRATIRLLTRRTEG